MKKALRWGILGIAFAVVLVVAVIVGGLAWLRSPWGGDFVRGQIETRLSDAMIGQVRLGDVDGNPLSGLTLHDFALIGRDGVPLIAAETVRVEYVLRPFLDQRIVVGRVDLVRPEINLVREPDGRWNFQTLWKPRAPKPPDPEPGWGSYIDIGRIEIVDGTVDVRLAEGDWPALEWDTNRFLDVNAELSLGLYSRERSLQRFEVENLSFRTTAPELVVRELEGAGIVTPDSLALREISIVTAGSRIEADGQLTLAPTDSFALEITAPRLDLDEVRRFFPAVRLDGVASYEGRLIGPASNPTVVVSSVQLETAGSKIQAEGAVRAVADPRLDLDVRVGPLAAADVRLFVDAYPLVQPVNGSVAVTGPVGSLSIDADLAAPAGDFAAEGSVGFGSGPLTYDLLVTSGDLDVGALIGEPRVELVLSGVYRIDGRGTGARELDAAFAAELGPSSIYSYDVVALTTRGRLEGRTYSADTLIVQLPRSTIRGEGTFGLAANGAIDATLDLASENPAEVYPPLGTSSGQARATADLSGTYQGFDVTGELHATDLDVRGVTADSFAGDFSLSGVGGGMTMSADGMLYRLETAGIPADTAAVVLAYADQRLDIEGTFAHPGEPTTRLVAVADFSGPETEILLQEFAYTSPESTWRLTEGSELVIVDSRLRAADVVLAQDGQRLRFDGTLALGDGVSDLTFTAENIALEEIARLTGRSSESWVGRANLQGTLQGPKLDPRIEIRGEISEGSIAGFRFLRLAGELDYADQQAAIDVVVTTSGEGQAIEATGIVPVNLAIAGGVDRLPDRPVNLEITGRNTDLSLLGAFVPGLTELQGPIDIQVTVTGTAESPSFAGYATLDNGQFTIPATGVTYRDIQGRIDFNNDRILVESLTASDGERGRLQMEGRIAMENLRFGELDLHATASNFEVVEETRQEIQLDAEIDLTGTTDRPVITGQLTVDEAIYRLPESSDKNIIDLDDAVIYVEIPGEEAALEPSPSFWSRTRLDLDVRVADDAVLTASNARIEIAGDLSLVKPPGVDLPTLSGTLDVRRGFYEEFGQRFTIESGEVFFYGTPELNPGLHIVATRTVSNVEGVGEVNIRVILGGTLQNPTIDLESSPPFDRSEILAIALFGTPSPSGAEQSRFADAAQGLVTGVFAAPLQAELSEQLGVDRVEFARREENGETETVFGVGKFLSPDVYLGFENVSGGDDEGQAVNLRYVINEIFTLQMTAGTGDLQSGIDLFWEFTY